MALFDYVMLLISVVLSLGLARLLETHARLMKRGKAVRWSPTYLGWFVVLCALHVDLWATLWTVHGQSRWGWTVIMAFFFQAVSLFYGAVLLTPDPDEFEGLDLWRFHLDNRRRYLAAIVVYVLIGCFLALTFLPADQFVPAVLTVGLPMIVLCGLAMLTSKRWAQVAIIVTMLAWAAWYFARFLPDFSS